MAAIDRLHHFAPRLRAAGIKSLYLFGSLARGASRPNSDIDLLFEAEPSRAFSLLDQAKLQDELTELLGRPVDLIERGALHERVQREAEHDLTRVF
ncbi:nucleotidyltransferase family protein [Sphingomonas sp.]|uniref:nucleotidyltransferase family protein n=1 Tax=Sphingomonas sp. TaxID=28214 RepID=UPI003F705CCF